MRIPGITALAAVLLAAPVGAQEGPTGIAIAAAPEAGFEACHGGNPEQALACARQKCNSAGGVRDCVRVRWCFPAGYAGAMSYLANREVTQVTFVCGAPSLAALGAMLAAFCTAETSATECRLMAVWAPDGTETERNDPLGKNSREDDGPERPAAARATPTLPLAPHRLMPAREFE
jgi:hypothetical protein